MKTTYIIAEAGVNHNGQLDTALEMVETAASTGADAIKFQTFKASDLVTQSAKQAAYQTENTGIEESQFDMLKRLELSEDDHHALKDKCAECNIDFLSSAFDISSAQFLIHKLNLKTIKLGSGELTNAPLLLEIAWGGADVIISSGMAMLNEIEDALGVLAFGYLGLKSPSRKEFKNAFLHPDAKKILSQKVSILQCTSQYPCPPELVNLRAMETISSQFPEITIGFSDHTTTKHIPVAAVAMGASIIEKHFTLSQKMEGPDHKASMEPDDFKMMIDHIRDIEKALGTGERKPFDEELSVKQVARKSIVAKTHISKGDIFSPENITVKRPEDGISPYEYWDIIGTKSVCDYAIDTPIKPIKEKA